MADKTTAPEPGVIPIDHGARQPFADGAAPESPAVAVVRDHLLKAIAREAEAVASQPAGQNSSALEQLARAYSLTTGVPAIPSTPEPGPRRMLIDGECNQRLDIILQDVGDAEEALLLLTQMKKYINLNFNNEVVALTEAVSGLNIR